MLPKQALSRMMRRIFLKVKQDHPAGKLIFETGVT